MLEHEDDLDAYRDWLREGLQRFASLEATRGFVAAGRPRGSTLWDALADLGLFGVAIGEEFGGAALGPRAWAIFLQESGRVLLSATQISTAFVVPYLLQELPITVETRSLLEGIAKSALRVTAADSVDGCCEVTDVGSGDLRISGKVPTVVDADLSDILILQITHRNQPALVGVDLRQANSHVEFASNLDPTRPIGAVLLDGASGFLLALGTADIWSRSRLLLRLAIAAEGAGATMACTDMAVEYAKLRHQFGVPIGQFQSIKHLCADMYVAAVSSLAATGGQFAQLSLSEDSQCCALLATSAYVQRSAAWVAAANMQIHGGIAMTWEHPAHLYLQRAKASQLLLGGLDRQVADLGARLFNPVAPVSPLMLLGQRPSAEFV